MIFIKIHLWRVLASGFMQEFLNLKLTCAHPENRDNDFRDENLTSVIFKYRTYLSLPMTFLPPIYG